MSKETTSLEALKRIGKLEVNGLRIKPTKTIVSDYNDYRIIETALKDYKTLKDPDTIILSKGNFSWIFI